MIRGEDGDAGSRPRHRRAPASRRAPWSGRRSQGARRPAYAGSRAGARSRTPEGRVGLLARLRSALPSGAGLGVVTNRREQSFRRPGRGSSSGGHPGRTTAALVASVLLLAAIAGIVGVRKDAVTAPDPSPASAASSAANGVEQLSAAEILKRARAAALDAGSARLVAHFAEAKNSVDIDTMVKGTTGAGTITVDGLGAEVRRIDETVFLKGNDAFNLESGGTVGAKLLAGKWLFGPAEESRLADAAGSLDYRTVVADALKVEGKIRKEKVMTFAEQRVIRLRDDNSYIYVALDGAPYPIAVSGLGKSKDRIRFSNWGQEVVVERPAPESLIDVTELGGAAQSPAPRPSGT